ncbi:MAG: hypothetical protein ACOVP4_09810 [Bacteriovoracaceae bacterium]
MKLVFALIITLSSLSVFGSEKCGLSFWDNQIEKHNEAYGRGEMTHQVYFAETRKVQKMAAVNAYECVYLGKTADLSKEILKAASVQLKADKEYLIGNQTKLLEFELKSGSVRGAVKAKMKLEKMINKFNKIEISIAEL